MKLTIHAFIWMIIRGNVMFCSSGANRSLSLTQIYRTSLWYTLCFSSSQCSWSIKILTIYIQAKKYKKTLGPIHIKIRGNVTGIHRESNHAKAIGVYRANVFFFGLHMLYFPSVYAFMCRTQKQSLPSFCVRHIKPIQTWNRERLWWPIDPYGPASVSVT